MMPHWNGFGFQHDPFGGGGITYQIDQHLAALREATERDDARLYASLAAQLIAICAPKIDKDELPKLLNVDVTFVPVPGMRLRDQRRAYESAVFAAWRLKVAQVLRIMSERGLYAKKDESPVAPEDATQLALKD